ncbi:MAG: glycosyltransferase [Anaplasmataceae bacterium]|nr:glycosyltransferase [Anaplasmataceae bacterium]
MKILFTSVKHDQYLPRRGKSFEYHNFYLQLKNMPHEVRYLPFDRILEVGKEQFNKELLREIEDFKPDLLFAFMYTDEFDPDILNKIKEKTTSVAWFSDDSWRFWNYSRHWAPHFSCAITTYSYMSELYKKYGQPHVIRSQWGANTNVYKPSLLENNESRPEVTFVGGWSKPRGKIIDALKKAGIPVEVFGGGWSNARRASDEEMVRLFGISKISLALNPSPGFFNKNSLGRLFFRRSINKIVPDFHLYSNLRSWFDRGTPQIKGRHFEIPACGGFLLTGSADDLENFYEPNKEMVLFSDLNDYVEKIKYYLSHDTEREAIAKAGYERTLRDHTYEKRFIDIFKKLGLS